MTKLNRLTAKIFGETASATNTPKEIGQFGSAKAGTYNATGDVATIQSLSAWSNGWIDAVTPTDQFPPLPEMTGVHKVLSYQNAYLLQQGIPEWDSGTTYYTNGFCSKNGKIYISQSDNNLNNDPESDTVNWNVFESGGARNIGEIVQSTIPLTDAGLHLLDGALIDGSGGYADFVDYIAGLYDSGDYDDIFETEANWQSAVTTYGVCGKFVYNSVNNTARLPKITGIIEGTTDTTALGDLVEAGLPNFSGTFRTDYASPTGDITAVNQTFSSGISGSSSTNTDYVVTVDLSNASSIYGNSNTVQPQTIKVLYYIVIATTTKTAIQVDIDEIATDLNGKADVDLSNVPTSKGILTESYVNGTSWYRVYSDGWCEQGGRTNSGSSNVTVTLLKPFIDTNYNIITNLIGSDGAYLSRADATVSRITTTTFFIDYKGTSPDGVGSGIGYFWHACGYIN